MERKGGRLTAAGEAYEEALRRYGADMLRRLEDALWDPSPRPCAHPILEPDPDGAWRCMLCQTEMVDGIDRSAALRSTDPRHRWCGRHQKPLQNDGGGPSPFSVCPDCYMGKP